MTGVGTPGDSTTAEPRPGTDPSLAEMLEAGLDALALELPGRARQQLLAYLDLLGRWNRVFRLSGVRTPRDLLRVQVLEALAIRDLLQAGPVIDVGSGAGSPGLVLAIACPDLDFVLLDGRGRRTRFLEQNRIELGLANVTVVTARAEDFVPAVPMRTVLARAVANAAEVERVTRRLRAPEAAILVMQAATPAGDAEALAAAGLAVARIPRPVPGVSRPRSVLVGARELGAYGPYAIIERPVAGT